MARFAVWQGADANPALCFARTRARWMSKPASRIVAGLPPFVSTVGLFVDADPQAIVLERVPLDLLQFHGDEAPELRYAAGKPYLKAVRVKPGLDLLNT